MKTLDPCNAASHRPETKRMKSTDDIDGASVQPDGLAMVYVFMKGTNGQTICGHFKRAKLVKLVKHFIRCEGDNLDRNSGRPELDGVTGDRLPDNSPNDPDQRPGESPKTL